MWEFERLSVVGANAPLNRAKAGFRPCSGFATQYEDLSQPRTAERLGMEPRGQRVRSREASWGVGPLARSRGASGHYPSANKGGRTDSSLRDGGTCGPVVQIVEKKPERSRMEGAHKAERRRMVRAATLTYLRPYAKSRLSGALGLSGLLVRAEMRSGTSKTARGNRTKGVRGNCHSANWTDAKCQIPGASTSQTPVAIWLNWALFPVRINRANYMTSRELCDFR